MAVDWGARRIGLAISDPTRTIASPLDVILHTSRAEDAATILRFASEKDVGLILVGVTYDEENLLTPSGRSAQRLAQAIQEDSEIPVNLFNEEGSTRAAKCSRLQIGLPKNKRAGHFDSIAAQIFLQAYLDENH